MTVFPQLTLNNGSRDERSGSPTRPPIAAGSWKPM